jgi:hypothetical protein
LTQPISSLEEDLNLSKSEAEEEEEEEEEPLDLDATSSRTIETTLLNRFRPVTLSVVSYYLLNDLN